MGRNDVLSVLTAHRSDLEGFGVQSLRLFGSVAREEDSADSDVDLLVSFRGKPTFSSFMSCGSSLKTSSAPRSTSSPSRVSERPSAPISRRTPFVLRNAQAPDGGPQIELGERRNVVWRRRTSSSYYEALSR